MRTLLLNDTRSDQHVGCQLVVDAILQQGQKVGIDVVRSIPNSSTNDELLARTYASEYDLLLINGEGTMHHDRPKALALGRAATTAARLGKCVVLANTVWQANDELNKCLRHVDLVFCRESLSCQAVQAAGKHATVVPDLVFATHPLADETARKRAGTAVIDSVIPDTAMSWAWQACRRKYAFMPMCVASYERFRRRPWLGAAMRFRTGNPIEKPDDNFVHRLSQFESVISGRFHGSCLAMLLGIPVVGIRSNTHKTEALFQDVGLDDRALVTFRDVHELPAKLDYVRSQTGLINDYAASASGRIAAMFREIRDVASEKMAA